MFTCIRLIFFIVVLNHCIACVWQPALESLGDFFLSRLHSSCERFGHWCGFRSRRSRKVISLAPCKFSSACLRYWVGKSSLEGGYDSWMNIGALGQERNKQTSDTEHIHTQIRMPVLLHTYIHTYIHTYLHTYILTYLHTYILTRIHTCILACPRAYVMLSCSYLCACVCVCVYMRRSIQIDRQTDRQTASKGPSLAMQVAFLSSRPAFHTATLHRCIGA